MVLRKRFEDPRALFHYHIRGLFELPAMTKDSYILLRQLIDQANNHILALKNLGEALEGWDSMVVYLLSTKLDAYTKREWEKRALQLPSKPKYKEFVEFLNSHCEYPERFDSDKQELTNRNKSNPSIKQSKLKSDNLSVQRASYPIC